MVKYTTPEASPEEHAKLTADGERMLQLLGLPYRKVALCTADIGFFSKQMLGFRSLDAVLRNIQRNFKLF